MPAPFAFEMTSPDRLSHELDLDARTCVAIVECSRGERGKYSSDPKRGLYVLDPLLPAGMSFPLDFGFVPGTRAEDGDPLDVMVVNDTPIPMGAAVCVRLVGVIEAEQTEKGRTVRNDRLIGVANTAIEASEAQTLGDLGGTFVETLTGLDAL